MNSNGEIKYIFNRALTNALQKANPASENCVNVILGALKSIYFAWVKLKGFQAQT